jgi:hypothetical protein
MTDFSITPNQVPIITIGTAYKLSSLFTVTPGNNPRTDYPVIAAVGFISQQPGYIISGGSLDNYGYYEETLYGDASAYYGFPADLSITFVGYPATVSLAGDVVYIPPIGPSVQGIGNISFFFSPSPASLTIAPADKEESAKPLLLEDYIQGHISARLPLQSGTIHFIDTDTSARPTASVLSRTVTANDTWTSACADRCAGAGPRECIRNFHSPKQHQ